jgi:hypothetical protein
MAIIRQRGADVKSLSDIGLLGPSQVAKFGPCCYNARGKPGAGSERWETPLGSALDIYGSV